MNLSTEQEDYSNQCMWTISNWQARQRTWNRLGKFSVEDVGLGEPTIISRLCISGCTQRECQISKDIVANYRDMFESGFLLEPKKNYRPGLQGTAKYHLGPMTWKGHAKNVWKDSQ